MGRELKYQEVETTYFLGNHLGGCKFLLIQYSGMLMFIYIMVEPSRRGRWLPTNVYKRGIVNEH